MLLWTLAAAVGGAFLIDRAALLTLRPRRRPAQRTAGDLHHPVTPLELDSNGVTVRGDLIEPRATPPDAPISVLVHGWTGDSSTMLFLAAPLLDAGLPVLVFDVRSHGRSDGAPAVTVRHFRDDLMATLETLREIRPGCRIVVIGHSLGGAAAILARSRGAEFDGLALIAAPADLFAVTAGFFSDRGLPGQFLVRLFHPSWRLRAGESFRDLDPEARAGELASDSIPVTIVQGGRDTRVPPDHADRLGHAAGVPVLTVAEAAHRDVLTHPDTHAELIRFLRTVVR
jgi:pimeloyl-ACP methyl ester carboxylesterase